MPKVSVIIPVYNTERYIGQCLNSVLNQTFKDIEIICINDGSTDSSPEILQEYALKDNRIKIVHQENQGLGAARNSGVQVATCRYLYFVDSDDWLDLTCIEKCYKQMEKTGADICFLGLINYYEENEKYETADYLSTKCYEECKKEIFTYKDITKYAFMHFGAPLKMYNKEYFIKNDLFFSEGVLFEDVVSHVKAVFNAKKLTFVKDNLYYYRIRNSSIMTSQYSKKKCDDVMLFIEQTKMILENKNIYNSLKKEFEAFLIDQVGFHYNLCDNDFRIYLKNLAADFISKNDLSCNISQIKIIEDKNSFLQNIFSIKNSRDKQHKIITILGIKIKFNKKKG